MERKQKASEDRPIVQPANQRSPVRDQLTAKEERTPRSAGDSLANQRRCLSESLLDNGRTPQRNTRQSGTNRAELPLNSSHNPVTKVGNTAVRRQGTWADFSGPLYHEGSGSYDSGSHWSPASSNDDGNSEYDTSNSELLERFRTTENERSLLIELLGGDEDMTLPNQQKAHECSRVSTAPNEPFHEEDLQKFSQWLWKSYYSYTFENIGV